MKAHLSTEWCYQDNVSQQKLKHNTDWIVILKVFFVHLVFILTQVKSRKERPINVWKVKNKTLTEKEHKNLKYVPWYHLWPLSMSPTILEVGQPHHPMVFLVTNRSQQDSCWSIGILNLYSIHITFNNIVLDSYY